MRAAGLRTEPPLPGDFNVSREWGNAEETEQERGIWSVVFGSGDVALRTLVMTVTYDHPYFHLPRRLQAFRLTMTMVSATEVALEECSAEFAAALLFSH